MLKLGTKVKCTGYLKPVKDGRFIGKVGDKVWYDSSKNWENGKKEELPECECDGSREFVKTYYKRTAAEFKGYVIGMKEVTMTGYLTAEWEAWSTGDYIAIRKEPKDTINCYVVAFRMGGKRLVPTNDIEIDFDNFFLPERDVAVSPWTDALHNVAVCPVCGSGAYLQNQDDEENTYCGKCGQKLTWSEKRSQEEI